MTPHYSENGVEIFLGDWIESLRQLPDESVNCCVTSPPYYGLRDYGEEGQLGLESTPEEYIAKLVEGFRELRRVLKKDGTFWLNLGDSYNAKPGQRSSDDTAGWKQASNTVSREVPSRSVATLKPKEIIGIPWMAAFALRADGWRLRQDIIWSKPNAMPESVTDRCTKSHEYIFLFTKSHTYHFDSDSISEPMIYNGVSGQDESVFKDAGNYNGKHKNLEDRGQTVHTMHKKRTMRPVYGAPAGHIPGGQNQTGRKNAGKDVECDGMRNKRSVWTVPTHAFPGAHFATFPPKLIEPCVRAGCPVGGVVIDPFFGAGTTGLVCKLLHVRCIGLELNKEYIAIAANRLRQSVLDFGGAK